MTAATAAPAASHPYRWVMLAGVSLIYYAFGITVASMAPLVAPVSRELGLSHTEMGSVLGAWPLFYVAFAAPSGALIDRIGPRRALFLAAVIIALSGALRGMASGHLSLFLAVAVFGLGGPTVSVGAPKVITLWFTGRERGLAMGLYLSANALGVMTSLAFTSSVAMPLADGDWRTVLLCYAGFVLIAGFVWLGLSAHGASRDMERRLAAQPKGPQLAIFADLLRLPSVRLVMTLGVCIFFFNHSLNNWLPRILLAEGMDAASAGYWAAIPIGVGVFSVLLIPRLAIPSRRFAILLSLLVCAAGASLLIQTGSGAPLVVGVVLQGVVRGALTPILILLLIESPEVGENRVGSAGGLFFSAAELGGFLGPFTIGLVADATGGFSAALYMLTGLCVLMMALLTRLRAASR